MKDYSAMSDVEINKLVGMTFGRMAGKPKNGLQMVSLDGEYICSSFLPCNNPADAWPIIVENKISILTDDTTEGWSAASVQDFCFVSGYRYSIADANPLRAAMITFLMMKDAENE